MLSISGTVHGSRRHPRGSGSARSLTACTVVMAAAIFIWAVAVAAPGLAIEMEVDDTDVSTALTTELLIDEAVDANRISVTTNDGIVTLEGSVATILEKERPARIAETIVGVRGVVNRITVMPSGRTDAEIDDAVQAALLGDPATEAYEVEASVDRGMVTLTGTVGSWQEKKLCTTVTKTVKGVRGVTNRISVSTAATRPDEEIEAEIEARLADDVLVDAALIDVEVDGAEVVLTGATGSLAEKNRAVADAWVGGVTSVDADALEVQWWARDSMRRTSLYVSRTDEEIEQAVKDAFLYDPRVLFFNPDVEVSGGTVTLTGVVGNLQARAAAEEDARNVTGVWRVRNFLKVRPGTVPPDDELEVRVSEALVNDPRVDRFEITVDAYRGTVSLSGTVNNSFEKDRAGRVAGRIEGVVEVVNNLEFQHRWVWKPDWEIREDIKDQLWWSTFVDADEIDVTVDDGVATLRGFVDSWSELTAAEKNAYEGGAKDVVNELVVSYRAYGPPYGPGGRLLSPWF